MHSPDDFVSVTRDCRKLGVLCTSKRPSSSADSMATRRLSALSFCISLSILSRILHKNSTLKKGRKHKQPFSAFVLQQSCKAYVQKVQP